MVYSFGVNSDRKVNLRDSKLDLTTKRFDDITYSDHVSNFFKNAALLRKAIFIFSHFLPLCVCYLLSFVPEKKI